MSTSENRSDYSVKTLTRCLAVSHANRIVELHNLIPYQHWDENDLLAECDQRRQFHLKWQVSQVALWKAALVGVCVAFHDRDSGSNVGFLYLHRIVVDSDHRRRGVGSALVRASCKAFISTTSKPEDDVVVQTPVRALIGNLEPVRGFYAKLGFTGRGEKVYKDRIDEIMGAHVGRMCGREVGH